MLMALSAAAADPPKTALPERVFISGHSLTDQPLPSDLAAIAASLGHPLQWNRQYMVGSSIRARVRGAKAPPGETGWSGYHQGSNRDSENMDVLAELRQPRTVTGGPYDVLLITEEHGLLGTMVWNDTVRYLRHYHDRFIDANPAGRTLFYESWLGLDDKNDPRRWIAYERAASPIWQCLATRINLSLAAEGRSDRIESLPAGLALAGLIERATQAPGVPGISGASVRATVDRLVKDSVHLTRLGSYYAALVSYAAIYSRSPLGAWAPEGIDAQQARSLQSVAWQIYSAYRASGRALTLEACRQVLTQSFVNTYWSYVRDTSWRKELGALHAHARWWRHVLLWQWRLRRGNADNPLHYDPAADRAYWLPAP
jgi:hypothetical protein